MLIVCAYCKAKCERCVGHVNRSVKQGAPLYCNKICAGLGRRKHKTAAQKKEEKRLYDLKYRAENLTEIKRKKVEYFQRTYDPAKAAEHRKGRMAAHIEYCREPEYRKWKKQYDRVHRVKLNHGQFWESFLLVQDINEEVATRMSKYEVMRENGTINKKVNRRREYERLIGKQPKNSTLGNSERDQGGQDASVSR